MNCQGYEIDVDAIRGGLVNLLHHSYETHNAGANCQGYEIDVMDFIKCELHWVVHEKKNPVICSLCDEAYS